MQLSFKFKSNYKIFMMLPTFMILRRQILFFELLAIKNICDKNFIMIVKFIKIIKLSDHRNLELYTSLHIACMFIFIHQKVLYNLCSPTITMVFYLVTTGKISVALDTAEGLFRTDEEHTYSCKENEI